MSITTMDSETQERALVQRLAEASRALNAARRRVDELEAEVALVQQSLLLVRSARSNNTSMENHADVDVAAEAVRAQTISLNCLTKLLQDITAAANDEGPTADGSAEGEGRTDGRWAVDCSDSSDCDDIEDSIDLVRNLQ